MAKRLAFDEIRDVLDVGCGVGHWGMLLTTVLPGDARITGIDREPSWVDHAAARARASGAAERISYRIGEAEHLPFSDDTFDLTTCQTVLIHLRDPAVAIREMLRVTRPGGLVLAAEPNNLMEALTLDSISSQAGVEELLELVRLQLTCERGKVALGEGDNSLGDRVPGLFAEQGLVDVTVYVNDKASPVFPPYAGAEQRAFIDEARDRHARRVWGWGELDTRRFFLAGGGAESDFAAIFERALETRQRILRAIEGGTYYGTGGGGFYVVAGRKAAGATLPNSDPTRCIAPLG